MLYSKRVFCSFVVVITSDDDVALIVAPLAKYQLVPGRANKPARTLGICAIFLHLNGQEQPQVLLK